MTAVIAEPEVQLERPAGMVAHVTVRRTAAEDEASVMALCGHRFVPSRDGRGLPRCRRCLLVLERLGVTPPGS